MADWPADLERRESEQSGELPTTPLMDALFIIAARGALRYMPEGDPATVRVRQQIAQAEARKTTTPSERELPTQTVVPAYGRDYDSAREAKAAWDAGSDFRCEPQGCYVSKPEADAAGLKVVIRYRKLTRRVEV